MHIANVAMGTLLESKGALRSRGIEVGLTDNEIDDIINGGTTSLARLAFAASPPGTTPSDEQVRNLFSVAVAPNVGTLSSLKRLIFEAQTLVVADVKSKVTKRMIACLQIWRLQKGRIESLNRGEDSLDFD